MPSKVDRMIIGDSKYDRRVKLTEEQKESIRREYEAGGTSYNKLAKKYNVSKRTIQFVIKPEKLQKAKEQFKERRKDGRYYNKDKRREYMRNHRDYKKELLKKGKLKNKKSEKTMNVLERIKSELPKRLREARKASGLTLRELAPKVGTTYVSINLWETGKAFPSDRFIIKLSEVLEVDVDWLLGFDREYHCKKCKGLEVNCN